MASLAPAIHPQRLSWQNALWWTLGVCGISLPRGTVLWGAWELSLQVQIPKPPGKHFHLPGSWQMGKMCWSLRTEAFGKTVCLPVCSNQLLSVISLAAFWVNAPYFWKGILLPKGLIRASLHVHCCCHPFKWLVYSGQLVSSYTKQRYSAVKKEAYPERHIYFHI